MAEFLTIARPYAVALFSLSETDEKELRAWEQVLHVLAVGVQRTALLQVAADPKVRLTSLENALEQALTTLIPNQVQCLGVKLSHFLSLILASKRLNTVPDMLQLFQALLAERAGVTKVDITSAFELTQQQLAEIQKAFSLKFGTQVEVASCSVEKSLIGGAVVRARDKDLVLDGSLLNRLKKLSHSLIAKG